VEHEGASAATDRGDEEDDPRFVLITLRSVRDKPPADEHNVAVDRTNLSVVLIKLDRVLIKPTDVPIKPRVVRIKTSAVRTKPSAVRTKASDVHDRPSVERLDRSGDEHKASSVRWNLSVVRNTSSFERTKPSSVRHNIGLRHVNMRLVVMVLSAVLVYGAQPSPSVGAYSRSVAFGPTSLPRALQAQALGRTRHAGAIVAVGMVAPMENRASPTAETASGVVEGIAIGRASVWASDPRPRTTAGTIQEEHQRLARAIRRATHGVEELVRLLPRSEAALFEPEVAILHEAGPLMLDRVDAGVRAEDAVNQALLDLPTDLSVDARARLLDGLAHDDRSIESLLEGHGGDRVLVTENLTPSVVAALPGRVVGIIAAASEDGRGGGPTSHAAILARGRVIPLVSVSRQAISDIASDELVVVDSTVTPAAVWVAPADAIVDGARARREAWQRACGEKETQLMAPLTHLGIEVYVNIGSMYEHVPATADGVGLVRTELMFADWTRAPSEWEQFAALRFVGAGVGSAPVVVRLFDAGGDKRLPWLPAPDRSPDLRGVELLFEHPAILDAQLRAITRAAQSMDVRVLLPLVRGADDVERVRARMDAKLPVGGMIETPAAVDESERIAAIADFIGIGTNDLFASVTGQDHSASPLALDTRVLRMIARVVTAARAHHLKVTVCGEMAAEPHSARILVGLGVNAISVATERFATVKLSLHDVTIEECRQVAAEALK
jgi:phosphoenolpyruvate-protein kinase (PTS system EI component)